jgi:tetratricopeptide (TPR) repeat protein
LPALGGLIALALLGVPGRARAETPAAAAERPAITEAETYAAQAFEAYHAKDYAGAVALYQRAYAVAPSADALYNIARVYDLGLRDRPLAINAYRRFLSDPGATADRIRAVNERLSLLREAERAESESSPRAPEPVPVAPLAATAAASSMGERRAASGWSTLQAVGFSSGVLGVVGCGVGIGFGLSVLNEADTANAECSGNRCASQRGVDAAKAASTRATVATASLTAGAALLVTGAALWFVGSPDSEASDARAAGDVSVTPVASSSELGLALSGNW